MWSSTPAGTGMSDAAGTTISSAKAPDDGRAEHPVADARLPSTPSPTSTTCPANSLPKMKGVGTVTWYVLATTSTSGKLTRPTCTRDPGLSRPQRR